MVAVHLADDVSMCQMLGVHVMKGLTKNDLSGRQLESMDILASMIQFHVFQMHILASTSPSI